MDFQFSPCMAAPDVPMTPNDAEFVGVARAPYSVGRIDVAHPEYYAPNYMVTPPGTVGDCGCNGNLGAAQAEQDKASAWPWFVGGAVLFGTAYYFLKK